MGDTNEIHAVTGAFSYTGKYIARRLLSQGKQVRTLTRRPDRPNPFGDQIEVAPLDFTRPSDLVANLRGVRTLYNTYWVRFDHDGMTFEGAVENTKALMEAAKEAGVQRFVHLSVTNASPESPLPYYKWKGVLEQAIIDSGLSYAIVRPTLIFGVEDILINNIAWLLRRFPVFAVPGDGSYRVQPISAEDVAAITVDAGDQSDNLIQDAAGPDVYTYNRFVRMIATAVRSRARIIHLPPSTVPLLARVIDVLVKDTVLTRDEMAGLMANYLVSDEPPRGNQRFNDWLDENATRVGASYASEMRRHWAADTGKE